MVVALVLVLLGLALLVTYRRAPGHASPRFRGRSPPIRAAILILLGVLLLQPTLLVSTAVPQRNVVGILVDDSRSMTIADNGQLTRGDQVRICSAPTRRCPRRSGTVPAPLVPVFAPARAHPRARWPGLRGQPLRSRHRARRGASRDGGDAARGARARDRWRRQRRLGDHARGALAYRRGRPGLHRGRRRRALPHRPRALPRHRAARGASRRIGAGRSPRCSSRAGAAIPRASWSKRPAASSRRGASRSRGTARPRPSASRSRFPRLARASSSCGFPALPGEAVTRNNARETLVVGARSRRANPLLRRRAALRVRLHAARGGGRHQPQRGRARAHRGRQISPARCRGQPRPRRGVSPHPRRALQVPRAHPRQRRGLGVHRGTAPHDRGIRRYPWRRLLLLGGRRAFGEGAWHDTPLEDVSPLLLDQPRDTGYFRVARGAAQRRGPGSSGDAACLGLAAAGHLGESGGEPEAGCRVAALGPRHRRARASSRSSRSSATGAAA